MPLTLQGAAAVIESRLPIRRTLPPFLGV